MTEHLNLELIKSRRIVADLSQRTVADAIGWSERAYAGVETGLVDMNLSISQLLVLAQLLGVAPVDLLPATEHTSTTPPSPEDEALQAQMGSLLFIAGKAVSAGALARVLETDTAAVEAAMGRLRDRLVSCGLRLSVGKPGAVLMPAHTSTGVAATRRLLRVADQRGGVPGPAGRMLFRLVSGGKLAHFPKQKERHQLSVLVNAGWVRPRGDRAAAPNTVEVHPDVRYSLALDDGFTVEPATATLMDVMTLSRRQFTWFAPVEPEDPDTTEDTDDEDAEEETEDD